MDIKNALIWSIKKLKHTKLPHFSASLDAEILLSKAIHKPKEYLYTRSETLLTARQKKIFEKFILRRLRGEPVAYITGEKEFYGRKFFVNSNVLIPRPETELIIEETKKIISSQLNFTSTPRIADIGSGSGCIAVTLKKIYPRAKIFATDSSKKTLKTLKKNVIAYDAKIKIFHGDLLAPLKKIRLDAIVANLPYLDRKKMKQYEKNLSYEPWHSLYSSYAGLGHYARLFNQMGIYKNFPLFAVLEINPGQKIPLLALARKLLPSYKIHFQKDLLGNIRALILLKKLT